MSEIKIPTVGRQVHYFTNGCEPALDEYDVEALPATVLKVNGTQLWLSVLTMDWEFPVVLRSSVRHKSELVGFQSTYWDWPEMK